MLALAFLIGFSLGGLIFYAIGCGVMRARVDRQWLDLPERERIKRIYGEFKRID